MLTKQSAVPKQPSSEHYAPADLLPVGADEVLLPSDGRSVVFDGVNVVQRSPINFRLR